MQGPSVQFQASFVTHPFLGAAGKCPSLSLSPPPSPCPLPFDTVSMTQQPSRPACPRASEGLYCQAYESSRGREAALAAATGIMVQSAGTRILPCEMPPRFDHSPVWHHLWSGTVLGPGLRGCRFSAFLSGCFELPSLWLASNFEQIIAAYCRQVGLCFLDRILLNVTRGTLYLCTRSHIPGFCAVALT